MRHHDRRRLGALLLLLVVGAVAGSTAAAQSFSVARFTVTDAATGQAVPNVDLCLTANGQRMQRMTDGAGRYNTTLQGGPNRAHFARAGYATRFVDFTVPSNGTIDVPVPLNPGTSVGLPTDCSIPATPTTTATSCLSITTIDVVGGPTTLSRTIRLRLGFSQRPEFVRVAEFTGREMYNGDDGFQRVNPPWERLIGDEVEFTLTQAHFGSHVVHVQAKLSSFGCVSASRMRTVTLQPRQLATYTLRGIDLERFVQDARVKGYDFKASFKIDKSENCAPGQVSKVLKREERASDTPDEIVRASYDVFIGPGMAPFWKMKDVAAAHPDLPSILVSGSVSKPNVEFDPQGTGTFCPNCTPTSSRRMITWRRITYPTRFAGPPTYGVTCHVFESAPRLSMVVLEGPAGEDPLTALVAK